MRSRWRLRKGACFRLRERLIEGEWIEKEEEEGYAVREATIKEETSEKK